MRCNRRPSTWETCRIGRIKSKVAWITTFLLQFPLSQRDNGVPKTGLPPVIHRIFREIHQLLGYPHDYGTPLPWLWSPSHRVREEAKLEHSTARSLRGWSYVQGRVARMGKTMGKRDCKTSVRIRHVYVCVAHIFCTWTRVPAKRYKQTIQEVIIGGSLVPPPPVSTVL